MENAQLTLTDIVSVKNLIEAACNRGTFKAHEMKAIGELYEKITRFVEAYNVPPQDQAQGETNA